MNSQSPTQASVVNFTIDGQNVSVPKGTTVFNAAKQLGVEIPIFCYHDHMPPFGACRVCLVEVEKSAKLQASCTLEATEGMVVKTSSALALEGRKEILELLLINHPLDCPICDRGGECPLQEHVFSHGPGLSRFFEQKRHFQKRLPLGPVLMLDRERCIVCARCTRFGEIIAGDHALEFKDRGYKTEVGTPDSHPAKSKFIGNTIMICPVGALTSEVYRFRARPWDNEPTESTCTLCPVGCSLILDSRDGEIMRTRSKENHAVNDIWLCDKGWFGYEFSSHPERLETPLIRESGTLKPVSWDQAFSLIAEKLQNSKPTGKIAVFGGNPLTIEENYLFQELAREVYGTKHIDHRIGMPIISLSEEGKISGMEISIGECEDLSYAVLLGIDLTEEFPIIWLRLKAAINRGAKVFFAGHFAPETSMFFNKICLHAPGEEMEIIENSLQEFLSLHAHLGKGAVFMGRQYCDSPQRLAILHTLARITGKCQITTNILEGCGNSQGARFAGMRPDSGPLYQLIDEKGMNPLEVLNHSAKYGWEFLHVAGANPALQLPGYLWEKARRNLNFLVVQDLFLTETAKQADVVLPTLSFVEKGGSFMNIEGRIQSLMPGKEIPSNLYSDAEIFNLIAQKFNVKLTFSDQFLEALQKKHFKPLQRVIESHTPKQNQALFPDDILLATFSTSLFDQGVRMKHNPHVTQLVQSPYVRINPDDAAKRNIKNDDLVHLIVNDNQISSKVKIDKKVAKKTIVLPLGFNEITSIDLKPDLINGFGVKVIKQGAFANVL